MVFSENGGIYWDCVSYAYFAASGNGKIVMKGRVFMRKSLGLLLVALLLSASCAFAADYHIQPTGERVDFNLMGNQFMPWLEDMEGNLLAIGKDGYLEYGMWDLETGGVKSTGRYAAIDPVGPESKVHPIPQVVFDAAERRRIKFEKRFGHIEEEKTEAEPSFIPSSIPEISGSLSAYATFPLPGGSLAAYDTDARINNALLIYVTFDGPNLLGVDPKDNITQIETLDKSYFEGLMFSPTGLRTYIDPRATPDRFSGTTFYGSVAHYYYENTKDYSTEKSKTTIQPGLDTQGRGGVVHVVLPAFWNRSYDIFEHREAFGIEIPDPDPYSVDEWDYGFIPAVGKEVVKYFDFRPFADFDAANNRYTVPASKLSIGLVMAGFSNETSDEKTFSMNTPGFWAHSGNRFDLTAADLTASGVDYGGASLRVSSSYAQPSFAYDRSKGYAVRPRQFGVFAHELGHNCYSFSDTYDISGFSRTGSSVSQFFKRSGDALFDVSLPYEGTLMCAAMGNYGVQGTGGYIYDPRDHEIFGATLNSADLASRPSNQDARNWAQSGVYGATGIRTISKDATYTIHTGQIIRIDATPTQYYYLQIRNDSGYDAGMFGWARAGRTASDDIIDPAHGVEGWVALADSLSKDINPDFWTAKGGLMIIHVDNETGTGQSYKLPAVIMEAHGGVSHMLTRRMMDRAMGEYISDDVKFNLGDPGDLFGNNVKQFPASADQTDPNCPDLEPLHAYLYAGTGYGTVAVDASGDRKIIEETAIIADKRQREPSGDPISFKLENIQYVRYEDFPGFVSNDVGSGGNATVNSEDLRGKGAVTFDFKSITDNVSIDFQTKERTIAAGGNLSIASDLIFYPAGFIGDKSITWSTVPSNSSMVAVDQTGVVTGLTKGLGTVRATLTSTSMDVSPIFADCVINVVVPVNDLTVTPVSLTLPLNETDVIVARVTPTTADNKSVDFTVSDPTVVNIESITFNSTSGVVSASIRANAPGTATVTATTIDGGLTASCDVTVPPLFVSKDVDSVAITPKPLTLGGVGATQQLTANINPSDADNPTVTWDSSAVNVATVNNNGLVTAVGSGTSTITVTVTTAVTGTTVTRTDTCLVTVTIPVTGVNMKPVTSKTLVVNETFQLSAELVPANASNQDVTWNSNNGSVASVSINGGLVTAVAEGTATITVETADGGKTATCDITVVRTLGTTGVDYFTDKDDVASETGIDIDDLETGTDGRVYLKKGVAEAAAKNLLGWETAEVTIVPIFSANVTPSGNVAKITLSKTGKELLTSSPEDIIVIGKTSSGAWDTFGYITDEAGYDDGKFMLFLNGVPFTGEISQNETYELVLFIEDGGRFDLDNAADGKLVTSVFIASEKSGKDGGGCNALFGLAFAILGVVPFVIRKRQ